MYFKRDKQSMAAKRPVRQRRGGSKVSPKKKRQLFLPESSGRTSCLVMSAVPPELPEVSGRSRAQKSAVPLTQDLRRTYWRPVPKGRVQLAAPGCSFARRTGAALSCAALSGPDGPRYFSRSRHLTFKKIALWRRFVKHRPAMRQQGPLPPAARHKEPRSGYCRARRSQ